MTDPFISTFGHAADPEKNDAQAMAANAAMAAVGQPGAHMLRDRIFDDTDQKAVAARLWLVSFTDLCSILLCFFLLFYSMREPDLTRIAHIVGGSQGAYAGPARANAAGDNKGVSVNHVTMGEGLDLGYLEGVLRNMLEQSRLQNDVRISRGRDHLKLLIDGGDAFAGDVLSPEGIRIARGLADRLRFLSNRISVAAGGDSGDWAGALGRVSEFSRVLRESGYRKPFTAIGEASGNPDIEIHVEADDGRLR